MLKNTNILKPQPALRDAESRRNAVLAVINLCETVGVNEKGIQSSRKF
jgi:hypothetical protein